MTPELSVTRFLQLVEDRAWTEAEKELDTIRQKSENSPWSKGYVKALEGLLLTYRSNDDKYIYLPRALLDRSGDSLTSLQREFAEFSANELHGEYDRGFFKALENYLSLLRESKSAPVQAQVVAESPGAEEVRGERKE